MALAVQTLCVEASMDRDRGLRFVAIISTVFCMLTIETGRVESRGACHYFSVVERNWTGALDICMGMSMCLADFDTQKHFKILNSLRLSHSEYWFGLNSLNQPKWSYVTNKHKKHYLPPAHHLNKAHNCGILKAVAKKTFTVRSDHCGQKKMFVCAESVFCKQKREFSRFSSGYNFCRGKQHDAKDALDNDNNYKYYTKSHVHA